VTHSYYTCDMTHPHFCTRTCDAWRWRTDEICVCWRQLEIFGASLTWLIHTFACDAWCWRTDEICVCIHIYIIIVIFICGIQSIHVTWLVYCTQVTWLIHVICVAWLIRTYLHEDMRRVMLAHRWVRITSCQPLYRDILSSLTFCAWNSVWDANQLAHITRICHRGSPRTVTIHQYHVCVCVLLCFVIGLTKQSNTHTHTWMSHITHMSQRDNRAPCDEGRREREMGKGVRERGKGMGGSLR